MPDTVKAPNARPRATGTLCRRDLQARANATLKTLGLSRGDSDSAPDGAHTMVSEFEIGLVMSRDVLPPRQRFIIWLAAACVHGATDRVAWLAEGAKDGNLNVQEIAEVFLQCSLYAGFAKAQAALAAAGVANVHLEDTDRSTDITQRSEQMRQTLHGQRRNEGYSDPALEHMNELYQIASSFGYGVIWPRPGLSLRDRLVCAVASLSCLPSASASLQKFCKTARDHGFEGSEVAEIVIQTAPYGGFPASFAAMQSTIDALGVDLT
ncbi:hypothetical protein ACMU_08465 [Actibacterium mucosum KCTC 23349]|uniref:Carboxymuconolactone decarboxylase-like domain-containing protein n=1 Tax=Actibacterium mucosum KCTC 23349 TaxID=1454373 RepID=A0A037ZJK5_9RHOB|nr:carboxymuconolactone decarboxylase family protein [Actibacterium mucosum]KAJ55799.1 hypothetical protein ACMU_08465 [Actibacterium mucosum KCTC 23349]